MEVKIEKTFDHNNAFVTEGLAYDNGFLYESTGKNYPALRKFKLVNDHWELVNIRRLSSRLYGESIAIVKNRLIQLVQHGSAIVYDKNSLKVISTLDIYPFESWGIAYDPRNNRVLISDGTQVIRILDADSLEEIGSEIVTDTNGHVIGVNELEYANNKLYANMHAENVQSIAQINPFTYEIEGYMNVKDLMSGVTPFNKHGDTGLASGIAYNYDKNTFYATGKNWDKLFEVSLIPRENINLFKAKLR